MAALAALLERPIWELAFGFASLTAICLVAGLFFFWLGFRIAEVPASRGFAAMFGGETPADQGNARVVPHEVADRLRTIQERGLAAAERASLGGLAAVTRAGALETGPALAESETVRPPEDGR